MHNLVQLILKAMCINHLIKTNLLLSLLIVSGFTNNYVFGQPSGNCQKSKNKEAIKFFNKATQVIHLSIKETMDFLNKALLLDSTYVDVYYLLAEIETQNAETSNENIEDASTLNHYKKAENYLKKVIFYCPKLDNYIVNFFLGEYYFRRKEYELAQTYLKKFTDNNSSDYEEIKYANSYLKDISTYFKILNNPVPYNPQIVKGVCTSDDEFLPMVSPDGEYIFYTRSYKKKENATMSALSEELMFGRRIANDSCEEFSLGISMPPPFNKGDNQGGSSITIDNRHFYVTVCKYLRSDYTSYKNCDIYVSDFEDGTWSPLRNLGTNINGTNSWEGQPSITANGKVLYFASARDKGFGGIDIYSSEKDSLGNWKKAENLGAMINTKGDDKTPYIHEDGQTLYFSSNGRIGMGGLDIFYSQLLENKKWTEPINIGFPINTAQDDLGLVVSSNGKKIYFSSNKINNTGGWDIFYASLYSEARPKKVLFIKGQVTDSVDKGLTNADIELQNIKTLKHTKGLIDKETGKFALATSVNLDDEFLLTFKRNGFSYNSTYIKPNEKLFQEVVTMDMKLRPIKIGDKMKLENIYFNSNSSEIEEIGKTSLDVFIEFLKSNPSIKIVINGHTDNSGDHESNIKLSTQRAKVVHDYIISRGIRPTRISYKGYGETQPVESNLSRKGRANNRRIEFEIIAK